MVTGSHGRYLWLEDPLSGIGQLIERCPAVLLDRYLAVTSSDSAPLHLNAEETAAGWSSQNGIAYSPRLESLKLLQYWGYDEWYVFTSPARLSSCEVFINFGDFSLRNPEESMPELHPTWDRAGAEALARDQMRQQERFWSQLELFSAESYIGHGDNFIFATTNEVLFAHVAASIL